MPATLVLHPGALGDILLAAPLFKRLKANFPSQKLVVAGNTDYLALMKGHLIDEVRGSDLWTPLFCEDVKNEAANDFFKACDPILSFINDPEKIAARNLNRWAAGRVVCAAWHRDIEEHAGKHFLKLAAPLLNGSDDDGDDAPPLAGLNLSRPLWLRQNSRLAVIHPGSGSPLKCWPAEYFTEVITCLKAKPGIEVLLLFGPADSAFFPPADVRVYRNRPLAEVAAAMKHAAVFLGSDSGITHLAAVLGTPTVAVFGPTDPRVWGPAGHHVRLLSDPLSCSPCRTFGPAKCLNDIPQACLKRLTPQKVLAALDEFIN